MEYTPSLLSGGAYSPCFHKTFKTTRIPDNIKQRIRTRWFKPPSAISSPDGSKPPPPLAKIALKRRPYLEHKLTEPGKCKGLGPSSSNFALPPVVQGYHLPTAFSPRVRLVIKRGVFATPGLISEMVELHPEEYSSKDLLELEKRIMPHIKRQLRKRTLEVLGLPL